MIRIIMLGQIYMNANVTNFPLFIFGLRTKVKGLLATSLVLICTGIFWSFDNMITTRYILSDY